MTRKGRNHGAGHGTTTTFRRADLKPKRPQSAAQLLELAGKQAEAHRNEGMSPTEIAQRDEWLAWRAQRKKATG